MNQDFSFIREQNGMFSFSGLSKDQVERLKSEFAIYIVGSGRISVAGITRANIDPSATPSPRCCKREASAPSALLQP